MTTTAPANHERLDGHNASVDSGLALAGLCGVVHLASGRTCRLSAHHPAACELAYAKQRSPGRSGVCSVAEPRGIRLPEGWDQLLCWTVAWTTRLGGRRRQEWP